MLQNTPTVYLSRLASPSLQKLSAKQRLSLDLSTYLSLYPEISTHADILLCQLGLWEKARFFTEIRKSWHEITREISGTMQFAPGNILSIISSTPIRIFWQHAEARHAADSTILTRSTSSRATPAAACCLWMTVVHHVRRRHRKDPCGTTDTDVLRIHPGHIALPGFDYGFIGGTGGGLPLCRPPPHGLKRQYRNAPGP